MTSVVQADSTVNAIRKKTRRLTASASESALTTAEIDQYINTFYNNDFPYAIKMDQMRSVYTFYTRPYIDRYPLDVNYNQGIRGPLYVEGIQGYFFKDRYQFYNMWPRWPTKFTPPNLRIGSINGATQANPCQITSNNHGLISGDKIYIQNVVGMTQLNGITYEITVTGTSTFTLNGIDSTAFTAYISGGSWTLLTLSFSIQAPFLSKEVVMGGVDINGNAISINDDGNGNLQLQIPNSVISVPAQNIIPPVPGMKNTNTENPGLLAVINIGTVNYVSGQFFIDFTLGGVIPDTSVIFTLWVSLYQPGRPYTMLFWNNEITIRPIPKLIHKIEIETYLTPVQFMQSTDHPILNQWWQYIAIGAAIKVLEDRQDMKGIQNLAALFDRQEALVLERQSVEEINQRNTTIFTNTIDSLGWNNGFGQGWY